MHGYQIGEAIRFYLDPGRLFVFDSAGRLVAVPEQAAQTETAG